MEKEDAKWQDLQICKIYRHMDRDRKAKITNGKEFTWDSISFKKDMSLMLLLCHLFGKLYRSNLAHG